MRLGIISDTHDQLARTNQAIRKLHALGIDALAHCGDLTSPELVHACAGVTPVYFVFGNNDYDEAGLRRAIELIGGVCLEHAGTFELGGKTFAVTHGDSVRRIESLLKSAPDYLLFGHWHVTTDRREGATRFINPGALHRAEEWTVATLEVEDDTLRFHVVP